MKKITTLIYILLSLSISPLVVSADVIAPNSHPLDKCVKFTNLDKFPDIVLLGKVTGPMINDFEISIIKNNECLSKGYKFNSLDVYWNTADKSDVINLDNLLAKDFGVYGGYVENSNPLIKETIEYIGEKDANEKINIVMSSRVSEYNNGDPIKTEIFQSPIKKSLTLSRTLKQGITGDDVKTLQIYLNTHGYTIATAGAGSLGNETKYFGLLTKAALIKFQLANKIAGDGIMGPITRSFIK